MRLHRALIGIVAQGHRLTVAIPAPKPVQRSFGEGCQLPIDRDPLAGTFHGAGIRLLPLEQLELAAGGTGGERSGHGAVLPPPHLSPPLVANPAELPTLR